MTTTRRLAITASSAVLLLGPASLAAPAFAGAGTGHGTGHHSSGCTQEEKQVHRAEDALARVTAVFDRQQERVKHAKHELRNADKGSDRARARREVNRAKAARDEAAKAKKAQQQRLAKAQERLSECEADQPSDAPS